MTILFLLLISQAGGMTVIPYVPSDSTPFVVKIDIEGLLPDTAYNCGLWIYGKPASISQVWTDDGWKGGYRYESFISDSNGNYLSYKKLRIVKQPDPYYDYYIKCTLKDMEGNVLLEHKVTHSEGFNLLNMEEGGYIEGKIYSDSSLSNPLESVVAFARDADGNIVGVYISEDNFVEEGYIPTPGYFCVGLPSTTITSILVEDTSGASLGQIGGEWEVPSGSTIDIGNIFPSNIVIPSDGLSVTPSSVFPGDEVEIRAAIQNTSQYTIYSIPVKFLMRERMDELPEDSISTTIDSIRGLSSFDARVNWTPEEEGNYLVTCRAGLAEGFARLRVGDPICEVVINEIMCYAYDSGDWIEIKNRSNQPVNIKNWRLESSGDVVSITRDECIIDSGGFAVICDSSSDYFHIFYGYIPPDVPVISPSGTFPSFRGTQGDTIRLVDADGFIIDEVRYDKNWIPDKGISMERITPELSSNIESNWGGCAEKTYKATPGKENSIYTEFTPKNLKFTCTDVFCPTSEEKVCYIEYKLPFKKAHIRLYVYDRLGRLVSKILDGDPTGSASYSIDEEGNIIWNHIWHGTDDDGEMLPMGVYIIFLEAQSEESGKVVRGKKTTTLIKDMR